MCCLVKLKRKDASYNAYISVVSFERYRDFKDAPDSFLHPRERSVFDSFKSDIRKKSYLMGRAAAKNALSAFYGQSDRTSFQVENGIMGHPIVRYLAWEHAGISISHDNEFAAAIAYPDIHPISVDIETINPDKMDPIGSVLTEEELALASKGPWAKECLYTVLWTIKEALSKTIRTGSMIPFTLLAVEKPQFINDFTIETHFKNFGQYKSTSFIICDQALSFVYPKRTLFEISHEKVRSFFSH